RRSNKPCATTISTHSVFPDSTSPPKLNPVEPPWYGPVCPVVGEGWHREVSPYPDHVEVAPGVVMVVAAAKRILHNSTFRFRFSLFSLWLICMRKNAIAGSRWRDARH